MPYHHPLAAIAIDFLVAAFIIFLIKTVARSMWFNDEEEVVTRTTTTTNSEDEHRPNIVGPLKRHVEGDQFFVIDPVDQKKIWLNSNDDLYEDADGKVWRLV